MAGDFQTLTDSPSWSCRGAYRFSSIYGTVTCADGRTSLAFCSMRLKATEHRMLSWDKNRSNNTSKRYSIEKDSNLRSNFFESLGVQQLSNHAAKMMNIMIKATRMEKRRIASERFDRRLSKVSVRTDMDWKMLALASSTLSSTR